jgi:hypothetical protein
VPANSAVPDSQASSGGSVPRSLGKVGQVGDQEVRAPRARPQQPVLQQVGAAHREREPERPCVAARERHRHRIQIRRQHASERPPRRQRERDGAAAGADVDHGGGSRLGHVGEGVLDERLGLGARHQHAGTQDSRRP